MNIVITGASSGIGYETAKLLATDNPTVAIARTKEKLDKLCEEVVSKTSSAKIFPIEFDLEKGNLKNLITEIQKHFNTVDVLINNAAMLVNKPFEEITTEELQRTFSVNVFSAFKLIQQLVPMMGKSISSAGKSHIVNISSMGGFQGAAKFKGLSAYSASKAALTNLTECLAEELKDKNIAVNCLALGAVQTEMLAKAFPRLNAQVSAERMAEFISNFALTGQNFFNGKIIPVSLSS